MASKVRKKVVVREIGVYPRDADVRRFIKHPMKMGFERYPDATPWPDDQFTKRRIMDGSINTKGPFDADGVAGVADSDARGNGGSAGAAGPGTVPGTTSKR